jgi:diacylglycerol O-acyltransferase
MAAVDTVGGIGAGIEAELIELPSSESRLADRIARIRERGRAAGGPVGVGAGSGVTGFAAPTLASLALREATRRGWAGADVETVVVNVPGPRAVATVMGRPMVSTFPVMPLPPGMRVTIGAFSYRGRTTFGVTTDRDAMPEAHVVTTGIERAAAELHHLIKEATDAKS